MTHPIAAMLEAFPGERTDAAIALFLDKSKGFSSEVIAETCERFVSARLKRNHSFAPSVPEFVAEAEKVAEWHKARVSKPEPVRMVPHTPLHVKLERMRSEFAGCDVIEDNLGHARYVEGCRKRHWPSGATYVAALATLYAPRKLT